MKRVLKFLLFIILIFALSNFEGDVSSWVNILTYISFFLSFLVLVGGFYYLIKVKKAKLFVFLLGFLLIQPAMAQIDLSDIKAADASGYRITDLGDDVCRAAKGGHLDLKALKKAQAIIDYWNKQGLTPSIIGGGNKSFECARGYIKYAAALGIAAKATCSPSRMILKTALEKDKCWPCDVTATILAGIQKMSVKSYHAINNAAKITLGIGYLFWLTITILVSFSKFGFEKFGEFFSKLLNQTIIVMIIALILQAPLSQFYRATISPFISFSSAFSMRIAEETLEIKGKNGSLFDKIISKIGLATTQKCSYCDKMKENEGGTGNFIGSSAINSILCLTCTTYKQTAPMIAIGQNLVCIGRSTPIPVIDDIPVLNIASSFIGPNYQVAIFGLILVLIFSIYTFLIGYFISTSVLKLGIVLILMPFFLVAFAFKSTRTYANQAWKLIVHAMVNILIVSLSVSLITIGFSSLMPAPSALNFVNFFLNSTGGDFANLMGGSNFAADFTSASEGLKSIASTASGSDATLRLLTIAAFAYVGISIISGSASITEQLVNTWQLNASEGKILTESLISSAKNGVAGAKGAWYGTKLAAGYASKKINALRNGKNVQVSEQDIIDEASRSLDKAEGNNRTYATNRYTYDEQEQGTNSPPPPPTSKA